jgi:hypothetical protein
MVTKLLVTSEMFALAEVLEPTCAKNHAPKFEPGEPIGRDIQWVALGRLRHQLMAVNVVSVTVPLVESRNLFAHSASPSRCDITATKRRYLSKSRLIVAAELANDTDTTFQLDTHSTWR